MASPDPSPIERERRRRQRARNWAIFAALAAFVAVVYVVTIVKMKGGLSVANPLQRDRNLRTLTILVGVVAFMTGLAYASVPLYRLFCQVTGYGGTPQRAETAPDSVSDRVVTVTFTADVAAGLDWRFRPEQKTLSLKVGENKLAFYSAENLEAVPVTGQATFNVSPDVFGPYFAKIECFCFQGQTLAPGQKVDMPVSFFIDPAILQDPELANINNVTLSYTFFRSAEQEGEPGKNLGQADNPTIKAASSGDAATGPVN